MEVFSDFINDDYKINVWKDSSMHLRKGYCKFPATLLTTVVMIMKEIFGKILPWFYYKTILMLILKIFEKSVRSIGSFKKRLDNTVDTHARPIRLSEIFSESGPLDWFLDDSH